MSHLNAGRPAPHAAQPTAGRQSRAPWWTYLGRLGLGLALAGALAGAPLAPRAEAAVTVSLVVDRNDDTSVLPCTPAPNDCTLRGAVNVANTNGVVDTITFSANFTITLSSTLALTATGTTILATPGQVVEINANNTGQVFYIAASDTTLDGLRVYGSAIGTTNVWIDGNTQRVRIANMIIGDDDFGFVGACGNSPDSHSGIYITSWANPIAGDAVAWIYGTHIKCIQGTPGDGIRIAGSREVVIGANSAGQATSLQSNYILLLAGDAVHLAPGSDANVIRNSALEYTQGSGLVIDNSDANWVYGNYLQVNAEDGVHLSGGSQLNTIGCSLLAGDPSNLSLRNVIRQNQSDGVHLTGAGTESNLVLCNQIGLSDDGNAARANLANGVRIDAGAASNIIGVGPSTRNTISGNSQSGVLITGSGTDANLVQGNYIGTNATGTAPVGNGLDGVALTGGASHNTVGGSSFGNLNVIGGNGDYGILISGSDTATNTVTYNDIGLNSVGTDTALPNASDGIRLALGTYDNIIGGASVVNYVAFNLGQGISLVNGAIANQLLANQVFSNVQSGVLFDGANTRYNLVVNLHAYLNGADGLAERNGATLNVWQSISTYGNGGLGIDKAATSPTDNTPTAPYPVITAVNVGTGQIQGTAAANATVELYRALPDPSGFGEGQTFLGSTVANGAGAWSLTVGAGLANCYTAFQTTGGPVASSEFGPHTCPTIYLPGVMK
jgi:hypothetical protein